MNQPVGGGLEDITFSAILQNKNVFDQFIAECSDNIQDFSLQPVLPLPRLSLKLENSSL